MLGVRWAVQSLALLQQHTALPGATQSPPRGRGTVASQAPPQQRWQQPWPSIRRKSRHTCHVSACGRSQPSTSRRSSIRICSGTCVVLPFYGAVLRCRRPGQERERARTTKREGKRKRKKKGAIWDRCSRRLPRHFWTSANMFSTVPHLEVTWW